MKKYFGIMSTMALAQGVDLLLHGEVQNEVLALDDDFVGDAPEDTMLV